MTWKSALRSAGAAIRRAERESLKRQRELERKRKHLVKMEELERAEYEVQVYENNIDVICSYHKECSDDWDWETINNSDPPIKPKKSNKNEYLAQSAFESFKPNIMDKLLKKKCTFITSNLIVHETTMLLERKVSRKEAIKFLKVVLKDPDIEIIHADEDIELEGYKTYQKYKDHDYSITDCVSFSIMNKIEITRCFTFDNHFLAMGFNVEPL